MLRISRPLARLAAAALALAVFVTAAPAGTTALESVSPLKRLQVEQLRRKPMKKLAGLRKRHAALREQARLMKKRGLAGLRQQGNRWTTIPPDEDARLGRRAAPAPAGSREGAAPLAAAAPPAPNVRVNDPSGDFAGEGQCETSIAVWGNYMVAAWNDSKGFRDATGQTQGWATSTDGGETWTDQGTLPVPVSPAGWKWTSDPVVIVNPNTGAFYYAGLGDANSAVNGVGVLKGRFTGTAFEWTNRSAARTANYASAFLDKEWIALDPANGKVYLTYTNFTAGLDRIEIQSADSALASWTSPLRISEADEDGYVQGSRPIVGPGGTVYVTYYAIGLVDADYVRICRSTNGGSTFTTPTDAVSFFANWGTGAPGFNRDSPIPNFPSIAVDRSGGPHDGRLYLSWGECLNWYDDTANAGASGAKSEAEPNETAAAGTPITPGNLVRGVLSSSGDFDYFRVTLAAGQTFMVFADSTSPSVTLSLRMFAADGTTRLAWTTAAGPDVAAGYAPGWIWTAPANGTYTLRVASQVGTGGYRLRTGFAAKGAERGSDQRDVFVSWSDNSGVSWSTPVRVDTAPVGLDGWLPEVTVGPDGRVWCAWYDWRDAPAAASGGESHVYLARSEDGGATWTQLGATSDTLSNWTACDSYIAPNQGDYLALHASATKLAVCWSDARGGTPDAYVSVWTTAATARTVALVSATAAPGRADLEWLVSPAAGFRAALERSTGGAGAWTVLDSLDADGAGRVAYSDTSVEPGTTYDYRLSWLENGAVVIRGEVTLLVPSGLALALRGVQPNPTDGLNSVLSFTLPYAENAEVEVFDLTGRLVESRRLEGYSAASHVIPFPLWSSARSGVYLVRLTQRGKSATTRVSIVR